MKVRFQTTDQKLFIPNQQKGTGLLSPKELTQLVSLGLKTSTMAATPSVVLGAGSKRSWASREAASDTWLSSDIISFGTQVAVIGVDAMDPVPPKLDWGSFCGLTLKTAKNQ